MTDTYRVSIDYSIAEVDLVAVVFAVEKLEMLNVVVDNYHYFHVVVETN
jgi:hypothetical protein